MRWLVYIVECSDGTYYTGVSTDTRRRLSEHNNSKKGAKYTRTRRPVALVYEREHSSRSEAMKEEYRIKKLSRKEKTRLILSSGNIDFNLFTT